MTQQSQHVAKTSYSASSLYTPCPEKKGATDFFAVTFTNIDGFS